MSEAAQTEKRVLAVAKELNIGVAHIVDFLNTKGFKVENKPTLKITADMYSVLLAEFSQDKAAKQKADKISLGRGASSVAAATATPVEEPKKSIAPKREEKEILIKNVTAKESVVKAEPVKESKPAAKEESHAVSEAAAPKQEEPVTEKKSSKAPPLEGPKILGKIDLDKKPKTKEKEPAATEEAPKPKGRKKSIADEEPIAEPAVETPEAKEETPAPETPPSEFEKIQEISKKTEYEVLSGPKVLGKIDLKAIQDKEKAVAQAQANQKEAQQEKKRQRKRIYSSDQQKTTTNPDQQKREPAQRRDQNQRRDQPNRGRYEKPEQHEVSEKQIQDKIKETMARLGSGPKAKPTKADYRRLKRKEADAEKEAVTGNEKSVIQVTEFISVSELASLLGVAVVEVIKTCMSLGIIVSINQRLDAEVIELVAHEFGKEISFISVEEQADLEVEEEEDDEESLLPRAPIVTIMGHVDHGKTSLLDYIREANVVAGEVGGITQHIGAYEVTKGDKKITFLDTPGHEAFTAMRARGAKITDIAVIVIAADDSVMPQTKEAISHAQAAGVPIVFAFNKMDKPGANADKIREQLASMNILVEEWGGKYQTQEISAKSGQNVDLLLEKILLEAEILNLKANPNKMPVGSVIEATLDKGRGYVATILVQEGTLHAGDAIVAGSNFGRIKAMFNERGNRLQEAGPSTPVLILGLDGAPQAGEKIKGYEDEQEAKQIATKRAQILREQGIRTKKHITLDEIGRRLALGNFKELNVIVKADFDGSVEALSDSLLKLSTQEIQIRIVFRGVGQITESDVLLASASDAIIVGFQVRPSSGARKLAEKENIEIRLYSIIYDAIEEIKSAMEGMLEPKIEEKIVCNIEVRNVFKITKVGTVAGCYVTDGKINRNTKVHLIRDGIVIYTGELSSLKRFKDDVKEVSAGMECGITIKNYNDLKVGDIIEGYEEVEVKRKL
jgi:translation initiation factor IF-2